MENFSFVVTEQDGKWEKKRREERGQTCGNTVADVVQLHYKILIITSTSLYVYIYVKVFYWYDFVSWLWKYIAVFAWPSCVLLASTSPLLLVAESR